MADLNALYAGTIDVQDPDIVIGQLPPVFFWQSPTDVFLPDDVRAQIRKTNADAVATVDAVKVPYTGSTATERTQWLNDRLQAINNRVAFISTRTSALLESLKTISGSGYDSLTKTFSTALSLVPVIGTVVSFVNNQATQSAAGVQAAQLYKAQSLIQSYTSDLEQLAQIRQQLTTELAGTTKKDPPYGAPNPYAKYYIMGGIALGVLLLYILYRRTHKRRKR